MVIISERFINEEVVMGEGVTLQFVEGRAEIVNPGEALIAKIKAMPKHFAIVEEQELPEPRSRRSRGGSAEKYSDKVEDAGEG